ncbi:hypothetical protein PISMIDRAFT_334191 [Pisolithus microcarpus 441]|uniref:Uncharacterized protein n=1 Tax=Pisolithus microcarpus 441 TaxID=765257 RepID=A0A0D0A0S3_9AGAM|nr:hypothetical protein PISMIDRAFT_334191 [Pisolithus microcarpus 441]
MEVNRSTGCHCNSQDTCVKLVGVMGTLASKVTCPVKMTDGWPCTSLLLSLPSPSPQSGLLRYAYVDVASSPVCAKLPTANHLLYQLRSSDRHIGAGWDLSCLLARRHSCLLPSEEKEDGG